ncbi:hypothetical protein [Croceitalea rosinachiae]|uniref:OmpA family protein n=1 Tax=Croceitalea rosinachiae TaxID=3075596 RepID=A0ABU3AC10_9FLAO|nr:hypothetical protein [Croceitalea sp. F388]MDT0607706.1 hypothetical protein [Croceitalea sp. F388]
MRRFLPLFALLVFTTTSAQKKSELIAKVSELEKTIMSLNDSVSQAQREINASNSKAELFEKENEDLRAANATLLQNLTNFSKISKQNTESVGNALNSLKKKEEQLRIITDNFSRNDSIAIAIFTQIKQTMGPEVKAGVSNGIVSISNSLDGLFGSDSASTLTESGADWTTKVGAIVKANPDRSIIVEGLNITGEFAVTYAQASTIANRLAKTEGVGSEKIQIVVKDGNFKEGISVRIAPNDTAFYQMVKKEFQ